MTITPLYRPARTVAHDFHSQTSSGLPAGSDEEGRALANAETEALANLGAAFVNYLTVCGRRVVRSFSLGIGLGDDLDVEHLSDAEIATIAATYVDDNLLVLSLAGRLQFQDLVFGIEYGRQTEAEEGRQPTARPVAVATAGRRLPWTSGGPRLAGHPRAWRSATDHEAQGLTVAGQELYEEYYRQAMAYAHARARDAGVAGADYTAVEQEAERTLHLAAAHYRPQNESGASFRTYLFASLKPNLVRVIRRLAHRRGPALDEDALPAADREVADRVGDRELRGVLRELLARLPPRERSVVEEHAAPEGGPRKTLHQIALESGVDDTTIRRRWASALHRLRVMLEDRGLDLQAFVGSGLLPSGGLR